MIKPSALKIGDTIGLVSPSSGIASLVPHRVESATRHLENLGFKVKISAHALECLEYVSASAEARASDLMDMFQDPNVHAIVSMIGGNHSNQVLKFLDFEKIKNNPKIFCGYSDVTVLHLALQTKSQLVTFYGPAALTQFAENPGPLPYTLEYFQKATCSPRALGQIMPSVEWTDEVLNWFEKKDLERPRILKRNSGWRWLKPGYSTGQISGGCIASLMHIRGTEYWPNWKDKIFFWEIAESESDFSKGDSPSLIDTYLSDLENSGTFGQISGMVIGRAFGYTEKDLVQLSKIVLDRTRGYDFPILYGPDIGHTDPMITLPCGVVATLNSEQNKFSIDESATV